MSINHKADDALPEPVAWADDLSSPQPHCVTNLRYCTVAQHDRGDHLRYVPLYTADQVAAERDTLRSALADRWRPIESAPRDGNPVLAFEPGPRGGIFKAHICKMMNKREEWIAHGVMHKLLPTHWMPLPAGPGEGESSC